MKVVGFVLAIVIALASVGANAQNIESINIGGFEYHSVEEVTIRESKFNEAEFSFLLNQVLSMRSGLPLVNSSDADRIVVGRISKLNALGDARVEIAFVKRGEEFTNIDSVVDMVAVEAHIGDSSDAVLDLIDQVRYMIVHSLEPYTSSPSDAVIAAQ